MQVSNVMKKMSEPQIVHESETQRQHSRFGFPATVEIAGKSYKIKDLSSGGVAVVGIEGGFSKGAIVPLRLDLPFGSFSLDIVIDADVRHYSKEDKVLGCRFTNLTAEQVSLINHVLRAFMAGDVVAPDDIMNVATRNNFTKQRKTKPADSAPPPVVDLRRQIPGLAAITVLGLVAAFFIIGNIYNSLFVIRVSEGVVSSNVLQIRAMEDGIYRTSLAPDAVTVKPGDLMANIVGASGGLSPSAVKSPCDCYITKRLVSDGEFVTKGTPLAAMVRIEDKPWVTAAVDPAVAKRIDMNQKASITIAGARFEYTGRVTDMKAASMMDTTLQQPSVAGYLPAPVLVTIALDQKIRVDLTGRPAQAVFTGR